MAKQKTIHITDLKQLESFTYSGRLLADLRGVTARAIERGADPDDENYIGIKRVEKGKYEARHSLFVMFRDLVRQVEDAKTSTSNAREKNYLLDAKKKELELAVLEKEFMHVDDFIKFFEQFALAVKRTFPASRKKITFEMLSAKSEKEAEQKLEDRDNELLNELSKITDTVRGLAKPVPEDEPDLFTAATKRKRNTKRIRK